MNELSEVFDNDDFLNAYLENIKLSDFRSDVRKLVEEKFTSYNSARQEIADYTKVVMDKIDGAKKRGAYGDLSVIAYELVNKLIAATSAVA